MKQTPISIKEIARKTRVSIATVSRATNPGLRKLVAPGTLKLIDETVKKYSYAPNPAARNLRSASYQTIGVLLPHIPNVFVSNYHSRVISGVSNALLNSDYKLKAVTFKPGNWDHYVFGAMEAIDGLVISYWPDFFSNKKALSSLDVPCVIVNDPDETVKAHFVHGDSHSGGRIAAEHLWQMGHRKIAVMLGKETSSDSRLRFESFREYLKSQGVMLDKNLIFKGNFEEKDAYECAKTIPFSKITAIFCLSDNMAIGVIRRMNEMGVKCPEDVSVMGYDNDGRSSMIYPALTTIDASVSRLGEAAVESLMGFLKEGKKNVFYYQSTCLKPSLVIRESVRKMS